MFGLSDNTIFYMTEPDVEMPISIPSMVHCDWHTGSTEDTT